MKRGMNLRYTLLAPVYRQVHEAQTLGADKLYRQLAVEQLTPRPYNIYLDAFTGTGLTAQEIIK